MPILTKETNENEWLRERSHGLGGSDVAGIFVERARPEDRVGCYRKSLYEMWALKCPRDETPMVDPTEYKKTKPELQRGHILEDFVVQLYAAERELPEPPAEEGLTWHSNGVVFGTPDRILPDRGLEIKTRRSMRGWGGEGTDKVPLDVEVQCRVYMEVFGKDVWDICVAFGLDTVRIYTLYRNKLLGKQIIDIATAWWDRFVVGSEIPEADGLPGTTEVLAHLHRDPEPALLDATSADIELRSSILAAKAMKKRAEATVAELENKLKTNIADATGIDGVATWKPVDRKPQLDINAFRASSPKIFARLLAKYPRAQKPQRRLNLVRRDEQ